MKFYSSIRPPADLPLAEVELRPRSEVSAGRSITGEEVERAFRSFSERFHASRFSNEEWSDRSGELRIVLLDDRVVVRQELPTSDRSDLAHRLDRLYELCFALSDALDLDPSDLHLGTIITRHRYERQFGTIVDRYCRMVKTVDLLHSERGWRTLSSAAPPILADPVPAIEVDPLQLPPGLRKRGRDRVGFLELSGDRALAALSFLSPERPYVALLPREPLVGDPSTVLRVLRLAYPASDVALVEAAASGSRSIRHIDRGAYGVQVSL